MPHRRRSTRPPLSFSSMIPKLYTFPTSATWRIVCAKNLVFLALLSVCNSGRVGKKTDRYLALETSTANRPPVSLAACLQSTTTALHTTYTIYAQVFSTIILRQVSVHEI